VSYLVTESTHGDNFFSFLSPFSPSSAIGKKVRQLVSKVMEKVETLGQPTPSTWANSEPEHHIPFFVLVTFSEAALGIVGCKGLEDGLEEFGGRF